MLVECSEIFIQLGGEQGSGLGLCRLHVRVHALVWSLVESYRLVPAFRSSYLFVPRQRSGLGNRRRLDLQLCHRKLGQEILERVLSSTDAQRLAGSGDASAHQ